MLRDEDIDIIKSSVTMKQIARHYGYDINRGFIKCPFHADHSPSMRVYGGNRGYYCFVCKEGGSIFNFVMKHDGLSFKQAARSIAEAFGIPISSEGEQLSDSDRERIAKRRAEREASERERRQAEKNLNKLAVSINSIKKLLPEFEPFSDVWCRAQNILTGLQSRWEFQFEKLYGNKADNRKR